MRDDEAPTQHARRKPLPRIAVVAVLSGTVTATLMQTFLTVSLPAAAAEIGALRWYGWVTGLYLVASTLFIPPAAALVNRLGPRTVYTVSMLVWALATFGIAQAQGPAALLSFRVVQGIGAAGVVPAGVSALAVLYHEKFGRLVGIVGATQATAILAGAPLGGWMSNIWGWRESLQIVGIVAVIPIVLSALALPSAGRDDDESVGLRSLTRRPGVAVILVQTMLLAGMAFGAAAYLPLLLRESLFVREEWVGLLTMPSLLGVAVGAAIGGARAEKKRTLVLVWTLIAVGALLLLLPQIWAATLGGSLVALGAGAGFSRQLVVLERISTARGAAAAGGLTQAARNIGGAIATLLLGLPMQLGAGGSAGAQTAFLCMAILALTVLLAAFGQLLLAGKD